MEQMKRKKFWRGKISFVILKNDQRGNKEEAFSKSRSMKNEKIKKKVQKQEDWICFI